MPDLISASLRQKEFELNLTLKNKAPFIVTVAIAFTVYQLFILQNSVPAIFRMYTNIPSRIESNGVFWTLYWFSSEFTAEIGLIVRFVGACLFVVFAWMLLRKGFSLATLRKAVALEGVYFLFYVPFIVNLFTRPAASEIAATIYRETAISYTLQTALVFSSFIALYIYAKRPNVERTRLFKWGAVAVVGYVFALWVKHFLFNIYALPINIADPVLLAGLLNSTLTMLVAALILLVTLMPVIREKTTCFSLRAVSVAFILIGLYFVIYILVATVNSGYLAFLPLTELWAITFAVLGVGFLTKSEAPNKKE